ncbi:MAG TPA: thiamine-binding protein [Bacteroidales bacterium]|jgi:Uncharacterized conserved protein
MNPKINLALQILPKSDGSLSTYELVDKAIEVIQKSGLPYVVCPFETVIEGSYEEVMAVAKRAQDACFENGATEIIANIKIQRSKEYDVFIDDKLKKYK